MFKLDLSLSNGDEKRGDRIGHSLSLSLFRHSPNLRAGLINIPAPIQSRSDSHLSNGESCPSIFTEEDSPC